MNTPNNDPAGSVEDGTPTLSRDDLHRIIALAMDLAREGRTADLLEFLDHGFPVDTPDPAGNTALMLAAYHGQVDTVRALLTRGADADARNDRDQSILAGALFKGEDEVARLLVAAGVDLDAGTPTARHAAEMFGRTHLLES